MVKKIKTYVKLQISAGIANPSPPVGPALGQHGINIIDFCKSFNEKTINIEKGLPVPVIITIYSDKTFSFIIKSPPASVLLKKAAGIKSGSSKTKKEIVGTVTYDQIKEIVKIKSLDMTGSNDKSMFNSIKGTAHSMGLKIEE